MLEMLQGVSMKVCEIFGLMIRIGGLGLMVMGVFNLLGVLLVLVGVPFEGNYKVWDVIAGASVWLSVGAALIGFAGPITRMVYGRETPGS